jgi:hypothetical protein
MEATLVTPVQDMSRVTFDIPTEIKIAIAEAIMSFSSLEATAESMIWDLLRLPYDEGRIVTQNMDAGRKFAMLHELLDMRIPESSSLRPDKKIWSAIETTRASRNIAAHGIWAMVDNINPVVVRYRSSAGSQMVMGEAFPLLRLQAVQRLSGKLKRLLDTLG